MMYRVNKKSFDDYIKSNDLKRKKDCWPSCYINDKNEVLAEEIHGFMYNEYYLKDEPNEETINVINSLLNK